MKKILYTLGLVIGGCLIAQAQTTDEIAGIWKFEKLVTTNTIDQDEKDGLKDMRFHFIAEGHYRAYFNTTWLSGTYNISADKTKIILENDLDEPLILVVQEFSPGKLTIQLDGKSVLLSQGK